MNTSDNAQQEILLVAGVARSGTTALQELLHFHKDIVLSYERYFELINHSPERFTGDLFTFERFFDYRDGDSFEGWGWYDYRQPVTAEKFRNAKIVGDKVPNYFLVAPDFLRSEPKARLLLITRNPLWVANSFELRCRDPEDKFWVADAWKGLAQWNGGHQRMLSLAQEFGSRVGVVVYEELFSGSLAAFERLLTWIGVAMPDRELRYRFANKTKNWRAMVERPLVLDEMLIEKLRAGSDVETQRRLIDIAGI